MAESLLRLSPEQPDRLFRTQAIVSDDLGMMNYAAYSSPKGDVKTRDIKVRLWCQYLGDKIKISCIVYNVVDPVGSGSGSGCDHGKS